MTPYNTSKVSIGVRYVPAPMPHHDIDAERLQDQLLGNPWALWNMPRWVRKVWSWL